MRLLIYNLRYCAGTGLGFNFPFPGIGYLRRTVDNLSRITDFIKSQNPDIVGLTEVDSGSFRSARLNQAAVIAWELGHYHCYESKYGQGSIIRSLPIWNKQGNAFLTRGAIRGERFHYFTQGVKRLVIELELDNLVVFLVHLSLKFRHRHSQLRDLCALVKAVNKPCIVAGDFNALWGAYEIELFTAATHLKNASPVEIPSYPSWAPRRQLDFILHSPEIQIANLQIPVVTFSDHLPLVCDFSINGVSEG